MHVLLETFNYVKDAPYFWASMGFTSATGIFIGGVLYNGDLRAVSKAVLTTAIYVFFVAETSIFRITHFFFSNDFPTSHVPQAFAALMSMVLVSIFYILGMIWGVFLIGKIHDK